jgi:NAD(P)H-hydrate epimerase
LIFKKIHIPLEEALELNHFKEMDYYAINNYDLPVELMMENAGLQLAKLVGHFSDKNQKIQVGVGNGNNGGGGLVAARRLAAWGFNVFLHLDSEIDKKLPAKQLERAVKFGAKIKTIEKPDIWIDAFLGFSQRLPLPESMLKIIEKANSSSAIRISLDIPTGFLGDINQPYFKADSVLILASAKKMLYNLPSETRLFISDLGIPKEVYKKFNTLIPEFQDNSIIELER